MNRETLSPSWERVTSLLPGVVYNQGNIKEFVKLTGWRGSHVLYIGDHVYSDLTVSKLIVRIKLLLFLTMPCIMIVYSHRMDKCICHINVHY